LLLTPLLAVHWAMTLGIAVAAPLSLLLTVSGLALALIYARYFAMLGACAEPPGSLERQGYNTIRENLATGGPAVSLYSRWLTAFVDAVDRFFGDAGMADHTLFSRIFGLRTPAPLWTAAAFNRCLLLALLYPIAMLLVMWAVSGHVGPAERALGLERDVPGWQRALFVAAIGSIAFVWWRYVYTSGWIRLVWLIIGVAGVLAFASAGSNIAIIVA
jgi:hypothetical protein